MSFRNQTGVETKRDTLEKNGEVIDTLIELGFIDSAKVLSPEDVEAVTRRMSVIEKDHAVSSSVATSLAYLDRMLFVQKGNGESEAKLLSAMYTDLISSLVSDPLLASNEEFLRTVANKANVNYKNGASTYSDALFAALEERVSAIEKTPTLDGTIDGQENVDLKNIH